MCAFIVIDTVLLQELDPFLIWCGSFEHPGEVFVSVAESANLAELIISLFEMAE
jgi:hypothetical protein